tara:strand:- start:372 stop:800 length:429 start_codon:yes stop_codon:yes gene_type:complete
MNWRERERNRKAIEIRKKRKKDNKERTERIARYLKHKGIEQLPELNKKFDYISFCKKHGLVAHGFHVPYSEITCECKDMSAPSKNVKKSAVVHFSIRSSKVGQVVACSYPSELGLFTSDISKVGCGSCRQRLEMALKLSKEM